MALSHVQQNIIASVSKDNFITSGKIAANDNKGADIELEIGSSAGLIQRILLTIPLGATSGIVDSCLLTLYAKTVAIGPEPALLHGSSSSASDAGATTYVYRLLQTGWEEGPGTKAVPSTVDGSSWNDAARGGLSVSWSVAGASSVGSDIEANPVSVRQPLVGGTSISWELAALAQRAVDAGLSDLHIMVRLQTEFGSPGVNVFSGRLDTNPPSVAIVYRPEPYGTWLHSGTRPKVSLPQDTAFNVQFILGTKFDGVTSHASHAARVAYRIKGSTAWSYGTPMDLSSASETSTSPKTIFQYGLLKNTWYEWKFQVSKDSWSTIDGETAVNTFTTQPSKGVDTFEILTADYHHYPTWRNTQKNPNSSNLWIIGYQNHSLEQASLRTDSTGKPPSAWIDVGDTCPYIKNSNAPMFDTDVPIPDDQGWIFPPTQGRVVPVIEQDVGTVCRVFLRNVNIDFPKIPFMTIPGNHDAPHMAHYASYNGIVTAITNSGEWAHKARKDYLGYPHAWGALPSDPSPGSIFFGDPGGEYFAYGWGPTLNIVLNVYRYTDQFKLSGDPTTTFPPRNVEDVDLWTLGVPQHKFLVETLANHADEYSWVRIIVHNLTGGGTLAIPPVDAYSDPKSYGRSFYLRDQFHLGGEWGRGVRWQENDYYGYKTGDVWSRHLYDHGTHAVLHEYAQGKCYVIQGHDHTWFHKNFEGIHYFTLPRNLLYEPGFNLGYNGESKPSGGYVECETSTNQVTMTYRRSYIPTGGAVAEPLDGIATDNAIVDRVSIFHVTPRKGTVTAGMSLRHKLNHGSRISKSQDSVLDPTNRNTEDFLKNKIDNPGGHNYDPELQDR